MLRWFYYIEERRKKVKKRKKKKKMKETTFAAKLIKLTVKLSTFLDIFVLNLREHVFNHLAHCSFENEIICIDGPVLFTFILVLLQTKFENM